MKKNNDHEHMMPQNITGYHESYIKMTKKRVIFLTENVTPKLGADLSAMLLYYNHIDPTAPIYLYIHSNGGDISGLISIYDVMKMIKAPIKTILMGKCYSAAAVILAAGTKGERYAFKSSEVMIHGVQFEFPVPGNDFISSKEHLEFMEDNNDVIMKILSKHTGQPLNKIKQDCAREFWMTAKEAKKYGIIDHIL